MRPMTKRSFLIVAVTCLAPLARVHAVSDGNYDNATQGCTGGAFNSDTPDSTEPHCYAATGQISDGTHNYVTVGIPMTADGQSPSSLELCIDLGTGTRQCALLDQSGVTPEPPTAGTPANPASGLRFYFGANDNLDDGEHDSSEQVDNGPSDGGAIQLNVTPTTVAQWVAALQTRNTGYLLTHPLPVGDAGLGFCADGIGADRSGQLCPEACAARRPISCGERSWPRDPWRCPAAAGYIARRRSRRWICPTPSRRKPFAPACARGSRRTSPPRGRSRRSTACARGSGS